jgi:hypothetical protein
MNFEVGGGCYTLEQQRRSSIVSIHLRLLSSFLYRFNVFISFISIWTGSDPSAINQLMNQVPLFRLRLELAETVYSK